MRAADRTPAAVAFIWRVIRTQGGGLVHRPDAAFPRNPQEDPEGRLIPILSLRHSAQLFLSGGSRRSAACGMGPASIEVPSSITGGETETGWCIAGHPMGLGILPVKQRSPDGADPGLSVRRGSTKPKRSRPAPPGTMCSIVIKLPIPPAVSDLVGAGRALQVGLFPGYFPANYKLRAGYRTNTAMSS